MTPQSAISLKSKSVFISAIRSSLNQFKPITKEFAGERGAAVPSAAGCSLGSAAAEDSRALTRVWFFSRLGETSGRRPTATVDRRAGRPDPKAPFSSWSGHKPLQSRVIECQQPLGLLSLRRLQIGVPRPKQRFQFRVHLETLAARWRRPRSLSSGPESSPTTSQAGAACRPLPSRTAAAENPGR